MHHRNNYNSNVPQKIVLLTGLRWILNRRFLGAISSKSSEPRLSPLDSHPQPANVKTNGLSIVSTETTGYLELIILLAIWGESNQLRYRRQNLIKWTGLLLLIFYINFLLMKARHNTKYSKMKQDGVVVNTNIYIEYIHQLKIIHQSMTHHMHIYIYIMTRKTF